MLGSCSPYLSDLNPIEHCFIKVKLFLLANEDTAQTVKDIKLFITASFASITSNDCCAWSRNCGYLHVDDLVLIIIAAIHRAAQRNFHKLEAITLFLRLTY